jgi:hypothetical protein
MADKFFHEFPTTTTLKDSSILLLDQDNQTTAITLSQLKSFLGGGSYTTVGNASAGIFVKAECFTSGSGNWVAPEGCTSARVTVVGGGGSQIDLDTTIKINYEIKNGTDSKFNYTGNSITGTSKNQLIAQGGYYSSSIWNGGGAGWNGLSVLGGNSNPKKLKTTSIFGSSVLTSGGIIVGQGFIDAEGKVGNGGFGGGGGYGRGNSLGKNGEYTWNIIQDNSTNINSNFWRINVDWMGSGGSGGINGNSRGALGGGSPIFSHAAYNLSNFTNIINTCGNGVAAGGWCTAIVDVVAGQSYSYTVGNSGNPSISKAGIVLIEY